MLGSLEIQLAFLLIMSPSENSVIKKYLFKEKDSTGFLISAQDFWKLLHFSREAELQLGRRQDFPCCRCPTAPGAFLVATPMLRSRQSQAAPGPDRDSRAAASCG